VGLTVYCDSSTTSQKISKTTRRKQETTDTRGLCGFVVPGDTFYHGGWHLWNAPGNGNQGGCVSMSLCIVTRRRSIYVTCSIIRVVLRREHALASISFSNVDLAKEAFNLLCYSQPTTTSRTRSKVIDLTGDSESDDMTKMLSFWRHVYRFSNTLLIICEQQSRLVTGISRYKLTMFTWSFLQKGTTIGHLLIFSWQRPVLMRQYKSTGPIMHANYRIGCLLWQEWIDLLEYFIYPLTGFHNGITNI